MGWSHTPGGRCHSYKQVIRRRTMKKKNIILWVLVTAIFLGMVIFDIVVCVKAMEYGVQHFALPATVFYVIPTCLVGLLDLFYGLYLRQSH